MVLVSVNVVFLVTDWFCVFVPRSERQARKHC